MLANVSKTFVQRYSQALRGKEKLGVPLREYTGDSDPVRMEHIASFEGSLPCHEMIVEDLLAQGFFKVILGI